MIAKITIAFMALTSFLSGEIGHVFENQYRMLFENDLEMKHAFFSIVKCDFEISPYEQVLLTKLRNKDSSIIEFRFAAKRIAYTVVQKVVNCMKVEREDIYTSLQKTTGHFINGRAEIVSIMRSGDIFINAFLDHFPSAGISKYLIQRDDETSKPEYKFKKISNTLLGADYVLICEPMVATGNTLTLVIDDLKAQGVKEETIIIACIVASPEAIIYLSKKYPTLKLVLCALDQRLNDQKFIMPGLGDFGDRFHGTE